MTASAPGSSDAALGKFRRTSVSQSPARGTESLSGQCTDDVRVAHRRPGGGSRARMGYIVALVLIVVVVPLLFVLLSRRATGAGGLGEGGRDRGVTVSKPSADVPTARADAINQPAPGAEKRLPPG